MFATMILAAAAAQAAAPVPPAPPAAKPGETVIREIVIRKEGDAKQGAAEKGKQERREIILIRDGKGSPAAAGGNPERRIRIVDVAPGKGEERREVRILREPGERIAMLSCDDGARVDSQATDKDGKKTRVMICAKGSKVSKVRQLRDAAKRIATDPNLSEETRSRITLAINEAIAKLPVNE
jgi:hypothetical protein